MSNHDPYSDLNRDVRGSELNFPANLKARKDKLTSNVRSFGLVRFLEVHVSSHLPYGVVSPSGTYLAVGR